MSMSTREQEALKAILERSRVDAEFRRRLLLDPRHAIHEAFGVLIPPAFHVKFVERNPDLDALVVLPDLDRPEGELSNDDLENVAGGVDQGGSLSWADGIPEV